MTPEEWDAHWYRIREDYYGGGLHSLREASALADQETTE